MLFNSLEFLIFLLIVYSLFWISANRKNLRNFIIVLSSYVFYAWWDWRFLTLMVFTSLCSYYLGLCIDRTENPQKRKILSAANIIINILILIVFKYFNFFSENFILLMNRFGFSLKNSFTLKIVLPVGISFYTFQALSYTIDIYRKNIKATHNLLDFLSFLSFFPQLVAGPIERAKDLLPQFSREKAVFSYPFAVDGARQMLWGFFKKTALADNLAPVVDDIFASHGDYSSSMLILGAVFFTFQIYCDFSGYSGIAIGTAKLFGIRLNENFRFPYFARNIREFWQRWHISLMTWLRDYIYFPLGGSRKTIARTVLNTFVVFAVSGLWHGANWTFVCWGFYHAVLINILTVLNLRKKYTQTENLHNAGSILITFCLVALGWIIFRAENIQDAFLYIKEMFSSELRPSDLISMKHLKLIALILFMLIAEWFNRESRHALQIKEKYLFKYRACRWILYYAVIIIILFMQNSQQAFIYFQF
ncbi:MAG: MBOAT family protein [Bacteroidales bacterium]|nr:MBOAT family protein [Bacteroidales bacterium]